MPCTRQLCRGSAAQLHLPRSSSHHTHKEILGEQDARDGQIHTDTHITKHSVAGEVFKKRNGGGDDLHHNPYGVHLALATSAHSSLLTCPNVGSQAVVHWDGHAQDQKVKMVSISQVDTHDEQVGATDQSTNNGTGH